MEIKGKIYLGETGNSLKSEGIKSVETSKQKQALIIELNQDYSPVLISLSELKNNYTNIKSDRVIFRIDNNIIQNSPDEVLVDVSNIMVISVSPIKFISDLDDLFMITLFPRTDSNIKKFNTIRIR